MTQYKVDNMVVGDIFEVITTLEKMGIDENVIDEVLKEDQDTIFWAYDYMEEHGIDDEQADELGLVDFSVEVA